MLKTIIKVQNGVERIKENVVRKVMDKVANNEGLTTVEYILLIIVVGGITVALGVVLKASALNWAATFDSIIDAKIDAVK